MHWEREQEANLIAAVLDSADRENWRPTDQILCDLIEMGAVDADKAPKVFQLWRASEGEFNASQAYLDLPADFSLWEK